MAQFILDKDVFGSEAPSFVMQLVRFDDILVVSETEIGLVEERVAFETFEPPAAVP